MTIEEAIQDLRYNEDCEDAIEMAIDALEEKRKNERPLELNEVINMPLGEWIWVEILGFPVFENWTYLTARSAYYEIQSDFTGGESLCCGYPGMCFTFEYSDYGETWIAYLREPKTS